MHYSLEKPPYDMNALEPHVSRETLEHHFGKHHRAYVDKLNELVAGTRFDGMPLELIVATAPSGPLYNNAAQAWNHGFYWKCMRPDGGGVPQGPLAQAMIATWGTYQAFREEFSARAMALFGSGWAWLVLGADNHLKIVTTPNARNPMRQGLTPLMTVDLWEHAYYIDHRNARARYLEAFWKVVNWDFVAENHAVASAVRKIDRTAMAVAGRAVATATAPLR